MELLFYTELNVFYKENGKYIKESQLSGDRKEVDREEVVEYAKRAGQERFLDKVEEVI